MHRFVSACVFVFFVVPSVVHGAVMFNEIAWMGTVDSSLGEWIELANTGSEPVNLAGAALYEAGGETLVIELAGMIAPGGYLLVERVTASVPDPVPGVSNIAGSFGGSGLSNAGEYLVLRDASGAILDSLDHRGGWLGGSASTKETMQKIAGEWRTATGTPAAANASAAVSAPASSAGAGDESATSSPSTHSGAAPISVAIPDENFEVFAGRERLATVGTPVRFEARVTGAKADATSFEWSFGDGSSGRGVQVTATYSYPGEYVVVLNGSSAGVSAAARTKVKVVPLEVTLAADPSDSKIILDNNSRFELNLGEWRIGIDGQSFIVPRDTIVLPNRTVIFPAKVTKFAVSASSSPQLIYPDGTTARPELRIQAPVARDELERMRRMLVDALGRIERISLVY